MPPPQPTERQYGIEKLYLCPRLTRATYLTICGEEAPPYDPAVRIKRWVLPIPAGIAPDTVNLVNCWDPAKKAMVRVAMSVGEAARPNLPGTVSYPKYDPPSATTARLVGMGDSTEFNGAALADPVAVAAILGEIKTQLNVELSVRAGGNPWPWIYQWNSEKRRNLVVTRGELEWDAQLLLRQRHSAGVGAPGKWTMAASGPHFIPNVQQTGEMDLRPEVPMPCRELAANERLEFYFGGIPTIVRTDIVDPLKPAAGGLTDTQDARLKVMARKLGVTQMEIDAELAT